MPPSPTIIVIVGISGDLAKRYLLPALGKIAAAGALPPQVKIVGITRREDVRFESLLDSVQADNLNFLREHGELFVMDVTDEEEYTRLERHLSTLEKSFGKPAQRLFYLSVPPQVSQPIIEHLGLSGLSQVPNTKLLLEKPFGVDLASAQELVEHIHHHFEPEQVYRIDHYMAKEMAQNLIVFREHNSLFKQTWNSQHIERIDIRVSEKITIEGRAPFYEQTGALRDIVQSHLLQLAALTLMQTPRDGDSHQVPALRLEALKHLRLAPSSALDSVALRAQYQGYREDVSNPHSQVETFVSLTLESTHPTWKNVPITLVTGKSLKEKSTEITITYRQHQPYESNQLVLRLQPNEGVELKLWTKVPGYERHLEQHAMKFTYKEHFSELPNAYEQVFLDAINSNHSLFTTSEEVLETWRIIERVQQAWSETKNPMLTYPQGSTAEEVLTLIRS